MLDWNRHDTILLDMDGTILDLAFDNYFWRELVPRCMARSRREDLESSRQELIALYAGRQGSLDWYCLDYWTATLELDLRALKSASSHRIRFLPGAREFLAGSRGSGRRVALVTNAHGATLEIKRGVAGLDRYFRALRVVARIRACQGARAFLARPAVRLGFDPGTTLFVDDSLPVLDAAASFGIGRMLAVRRPDSARAGSDRGDASQGGERSGAGRGWELPASVAPTRRIFRAAVRRRLGLRRRRLTSGRIAGGRLVGTPLPAGPPRAVLRPPTARCSRQVRASSWRRRWPLEVGQFSGIVGTSWNAMADVRLDFR